MAIRLGSRVKDTYTGFTGVATGRTEYLYGCVRVLIEPTNLDKDGKVQDPQWFDEQRVELVELEQPKVSTESKANTGGPHDAPTRTADPVR